MSTDDRSLLSQNQTAGQTLSVLSPFEAISTLHWAKDAWCGFYRKDSGWQELGCVQIRDKLETQFELFGPELRVDSYFTINSLFAGRSFRQGTFGLPVYSRSRANLRWLNAAYVDIDDYNSGFEDNLSQLGSIPSPHIVVSSGRGLWFLWLLSDTVQGSPLPAFSSTVAILESINRALREHFRRSRSRRKTNLPVRRVARDRSIGIR